MQPCGNPFGPADYLLGQHRLEPDADPQGCFVGPDPYARIIPEYRTDETNR